MKILVEITFQFAFILFLLIFATGLLIESYEIAGLGLLGVIAECYIFKTFLDKGWFHYQQFLIIFPTAFLSRLAVGFKK